MGQFGSLPSSESLAARSVAHLMWKTCLQGSTTATLPSEGKGLLHKEQSWPNGPTEGLIFITTSIQLFFCYLYPINMCNLSGAPPKRLSPTSFDGLPWIRKGGNGSERDSPIYPCIFLLSFVIRPLCQAKVQHKKQLFSYLHRWCPGISPANGSFTSLGLEDLQPSGLVILQSTRMIQ